MKKMVAVVGPTAVGKSDLAVELALEFGGEVVSTDSRQVYKGLDIGTGKITEEEMRDVPHHLLDVADPQGQYTVAEWKEDAERAVRGILERGNLPIVCGGTGQYIQALVDNISFPDVPPSETLREKLTEKSTDELFVILEEKDPRRASTIDCDNPRRLIRAIEIADALGEVPEVTSQPKFDTLQIGLMLPRDEIRERIRARLEKRIDEGLVEEAEALHKNGLSYERMDALGLEYRYLAKYLQGELSQGEMKEKLETEIYRYAVRQLRWFKHDKRIIWFSPGDQSQVFEKVKVFLGQK